MAKQTGYKRIYKMRRLIKERKYITVGIPWEVVQREADTRSLTVDEFIKEYVTEVEYNGFDGIQYRFIKNPNLPKQEVKSQV